MFCNTNLNNKQIAVLYLRCKHGKQFKFLARVQKITMHQNYVHKIDIV